jgi:phosphate transport system protein
MIYMHRHFEEELQILKEKLLRMSSLVEESISLSIKSLVERDSVLAEKVVGQDDMIDGIEIEVDGLCLNLLALQQPQARDLRFITGSLKIVNDLERMGDLAVNIAHRSLDLLKVPLLKPLIDIPRMAQLAQAMLKDSLNAFVNDDVQLAREVCMRDDEVDKLNVQIFRELLTYMLQDPSSVQRAVDLILVAKNLERIADHSTNIAEDVIYIVEARVVKHHMEEA